MMTQRPHVIHLVDDTTAGGVMRVLDFLRSDGELGQSACHEVKSVSRGKRIPNLGNPDVIVSHLAVSWRSLPSLVALRAAYVRAPMVHVEHSYTERFMAHNVPNARRFKTLLRLAYSMFNRIVCVSEGQTRWMVSNRLVHAGKVFTIQSCVDLSAFRDLPAPTGAVRVFGAIGRLDDQKGFDTLIKAFRRSTDPEIKLHIIGEGAQEAALRTLAGGDPRIIFRGFEPDPVAALRDVDVVLMPSRWEAYGLVAIEALSAGRRLICHNIDGLGDHARYGGVMVDDMAEKDLGDLITAEANSGGTVRPQSLVRTTGHLENRFRNRWQALLGEVGA